MTKYFAIAAALLVSTGASAQSLDARHHGAAVRPAVAARHAVLDNIIGRVQMDALISTLVETEIVAPTRLAADAVASGNTKLSRPRRDVAYASAAPITRTRG